MKASFCEECVHFDEVLLPKTVCGLGHKPRFYYPRGYTFTDYGWKRRCDDFQECRVTYIVYNKF
jgi:hypothetical protein